MMGVSHLRNSHLSSHWWAGRGVRWGGGEYGWQPPFLTPICGVWSEWSMPKLGRAYVNATNEYDMNNCCFCFRPFSMDKNTYQTIDVSVQNGVQVIRLNRPEKRNAINKDVSFFPWILFISCYWIWKVELTSTSLIYFRFKMYAEIPEALQAGAANNDVVVTVVTGTGSYYCSGNDLSGYLSWGNSDLEKTLQDAAVTVQSVFFSFPIALSFCSVPSR